MRARDNPFAVHRVLAYRYRWTEADWTCRMERLVDMQFQAAIVGPHGSGKTTLLEDLIDRLRTDGRHCWSKRLHTGDRRMPTRVLDQIFALPAETLVLLDGAEQLGTTHWRRLARFFRRTARPLIVTLHAPGRWPTWVTTRQDIPVLHDMTAQLLQDQPVNMRIVQAVNRELFAKHRGNIRDALRDWYDIAAGMSESPTSWEECLAENPATAPLESHVTAQ